jgi:flavin reductase (DIM6/NTAB) family NADH-FMN oxidoreductase RutF
MEDSVCIWIDCSVQPILFVIDSNHCLVEGNVIRVRTVVQDSERRPDVIRTG